MINYPILNKKLKLAGIDINVIKEKKIIYSYYGKEPGKGILSDPKMKLIKYISPSNSTRNISVSHLNGSFNPNYYSGQDFCGEIDLYKALAEVSALEIYSIKDFVEATLNGDITTEMDVITVDGQSYINNDGNHRMLFLKSMYEQELSEGKSREELDKKYRISVKGIELPKTIEQQVCFGILGDLNSNYNSHPCFEMIVKDGNCTGYLLTEKNTGKKIELNNQEDIIKYTQKTVLQNYLNGNSIQLDNCLQFWSEEPEFKEKIEQIFPQIKLLKELNKVEENIPRFYAYHDGMNLLDKEQNNKILNKYNNTSEFEKIVDIIKELKQKLTNENVNSEQIKQCETVILNELATNIESLNDAKNIYKELLDNDVMAAVSEKINGLIANDKKSNLDQQISQLQNKKLGFLDRMSGKVKLRDLQIENLKLQKDNIQPENRNFSNLKELSITLKDYIIQNGMDEELSNFIFQHPDILSYPKKYYSIGNNINKLEVYKRERKPDVLAKKMSFREIRSSLKTLKQENQELLNTSNHRTPNQSLFQNTINISPKELEANQKIFNFKSKATEVLKIFQERDEKGLESEKDL